MAENLNYNTKSGNDVFLNNDSVSYSEPYGRLYNWSGFMAGDSTSTSVPSGVQGVCPVGWHIPSDKEWKIMELNIGVLYSELEYYTKSTAEGAKMRSIDSSWTSVVDNFDSFGFGAKGVGIYDPTATTFYYYKTRCVFATSTLRPSYTNQFVIREIHHNNKGLIYTSLQTTHYTSVRCVKNE
tara:strand:+ start:60 stop:605 length:546 start_codon:yes stop_codon:yes gene_type:complete